MEQADDDDAALPHKEEDDEDDDANNLDKILQTEAAARKKSKRYKSMKKLAGDKLDQYQLNDDFYDNDDALSDEYSEKDQSKNFITGQSNEKQASINFYSYEFESIIKGKKGNSLIKFLSEQPLDSPLFESSTMQAYMDAQWQQFKWRYFMIVFLYLIAFLIMFPYFELFVHAMKDNGQPLSYIMQKHYVFFFMFLPV